MYCEVETIKRVHGKQDNNNGTVNQNFRKKCVKSSLHPNNELHA